MAASSASSTASTHIYPQPEVHGPHKGPHKQSFIILHGRGGAASNFAVPLMSFPIRRTRPSPYSAPSLFPSSSTKGVSEPLPKPLQQFFPHAKFIFPTAALNSAQALGGDKMTQWFDIWSLQKQTEREELQYRGLRESVAFIHGLLRDEIDAVGAENVVLWGLSQGCAVSLTAALLWQGEKFGAVVGMCGWLPLRGRLENFMHTIIRTIDEEGHEGNPAETAKKDANHPERETITHLADTIMFDSSQREPSMTFQKIPMFLGHGWLDPKIPVSLAEEADMFLTYLGVDVRLREYENLGHWYSRDMLADVMDFLNEKVGFGEKKAGPRIKDLCQPCAVS